MNCIKCGESLPPDSLYCNLCGKKQISQSGTRQRRAKGAGSVYRRSTDKTWTASTVLGYEKLDNGKLKAIRPCKYGFKSKSDAIKYLPNLERQGKKIDDNISFKGLYDLWFSDYEKRDRSGGTVRGHKAAIKHFHDIWYIKFSDVHIDDLQECMYDCERGRRTKENMKSMAGMMYDYAIPRGYRPDKLNLGRYLYIGNDKQTTRENFKDYQIEVIRKNLDIVKYADWIYSHIYLGFRTHEFISLLIEKNYNHEGKFFIAGEKTEAGIDRKVTISPKILPIIESLIGDRTSGPVFTIDGSPLTTEQYRKECFYPALEVMGFDNPIDPQTETHKYTPYCCRHTFATLMKNVDGADVDKLSLIGHTNVEMLNKYQHTDLSSLRMITDQI